MQPMTLRQLTEALERKDQDEKVRFDFVYFRPTHFTSYRGDYAQLAIGYTNEYNDVRYPELSVADLVKMCQEANGKEYMGYKGGDYTMHDNTLVWVANPDEAGRTGIVDVCDGLYVTLKTAKFE